MIGRIVSCVEPVAIRCRDELLLFIVSLSLHSALLPTWNTMLIAYLKVNTLLLVRHSALFPSMSPSSTVIQLKVIVRPLKTTVRKRKSSQRNRMYLLLKSRLVGQVCTWGDTCKRSHLLIIWKLHKRVQLNFYDCSIVNGIIVAIRIFWKQFFHFLSRCLLLSLGIAFPQIENG